MKNNLSDLQQVIFDLIYDSPNISEAVAKVLEAVGEHFDISRAYVFENSEDNKSASNTFEWCAPGIEPQIDNLQQIAYADVDYYLFDKNGVFICDDVSKLRNEKMREIFEAQDIKATLQCGIYVDGVLRGLVGYDDCVRTRDKWDDSSRKVLTYIAKLLAVGLIKERSMRRTEKLQAELEARLSTEQKLREAAIKANRSKSLFFANVSHDMRTPLNGIVGFTDIALATDDNAVKNDCLSKIKASSEFLMELINATLEYSKLEGGKFDFNYTAERLTDVLNVTINNIRIMCEAKGLTLNYRVDKASDRYYKVDKVRMLEIASNLLTNAVKFTPRGGTIDVNMFCDDETETDVRVTMIVKDSGIGMSKEFMAHMYEPFTQEEGISATHGGIGLGLSIVYRFIKAMGGTIDMKSELKKGTEFTVRVRAEKTTDAKRKETSAALNFEKILVGKKILICEDNKINAELLTYILTKMGAETEVAVDGQEGLDMFVKSAKDEFAAIFMDIRMPIMDGLESARRIRASSHGSAKTVPIIAVSANVGCEDMIKSADAGMDAHLAKPINAKELSETLTELLNLNKKQ